MQDSAPTLTPYDLKSINRLVQFSKDKTRVINPEPFHDRRLNHWGVYVGVDRQPAKEPVYFKTREAALAGLVKAGVLGVAEPEVTLPPAEVPVVEAAPEPAAPAVEPAAETPVEDTPVVMDETVIDIPVAAEPETPVESEAPAADKGSKRKRNRG